MSISLTEMGIDQLSLEDRMFLVEELWNSISDELQRLPLTEAQTYALDCRLAAHEENPNDTIPWEVVREQALHKLRR